MVGSAPKICCFFRPFLCEVAAWMYGVRGFVAEAKSLLFPLVSSAVPARTLPIHTIFEPSSATTTIAMAASM